MFQRFIPHSLAFIFFLALGIYWYEQLTEPQLPVIGPPAAASTDPALPDFSTYARVKEKKTAFFNFVLPFVLQENQRIAEVRAALIDLKSKVSAPSLSSHQINWIRKLAQRYRVETDAMDDAEQIEAVIDQLLVKVDEVPPSLALAQAANESAWGTSRFAIKGNNLFGQWCFSRGCGIVPGSRDDDASHEVAKFTSPRKSVESYILNINRNDAYTDLREIRAAEREANGKLRGMKLAEGLGKYSTRGEEYIAELRQMIRFNRLGEYDDV